MEDTSNMFEIDVRPPAKKQAVQWRLVTNQRNLFYMLAAGLIMSPKGFGKKYYQDTLAAFPGWVPLFADTVPKAAIQYSVSERSHLIPCIASVDLGALHGMVRAIDMDGTVKEVDFPSGLTGSERLLLVPAPLPATGITSIGIQSKEDKSNCETDARDFDNVPFLDFKREVCSRAFSEAPGEVWPLEWLTLPDRDSAMDIPLAAGGMMAMLIHQADSGDLGVQSCRFAFDPFDADPTNISDPIIAGLPDWIQKGHASDTRDVLKNLFWGAVDAVATCRSSDTCASPLDAILGHLEASKSALDDRMNRALSKLATDLRTLAGFSDSTITEIFERHPKPFSRVMMLFFLREKCADLLEFKHPLLSTPDYIAASILFAARDGWLGLPTSLRDIPGLQSAVSHRMAAMAHRMSNSNVNLGTPPARPVVLRELFTPGPKGWGNAQKDAALLLAREVKWDCIETRVSLGKGEYRVLVDGVGVHIIQAGDVKSVATEVDRDKFLLYLTEAQVSAKTDRKIREIIKDK